MTKYCMDCDRYIPGGICRKTGKVTGALKEMCGTKEPVVSDQQKYCGKCKRNFRLISLQRIEGTQMGSNRIARIVQGNHSRAGKMVISRQYDGLHNRH